MSRRTDFAIATLLLMTCVLTSGLEIPSVLALKASASCSVAEHGEAGPGFNTLYIKYFENRTLLFEALKDGEVDLTDLTLRQSEWDEVVNETSLQGAISPANTVFQFDFNNNESIPSYPDIRSPTSYQGFRRGIACLVNKTRIINDVGNYSYYSHASSYLYRIDTPIPRPNQDWWVNFDVSQYDPYGDLLGNYPYEYDPDLAASYFTLSGFREGDNESGTLNPYYDPSFPSSSQYLRQHPVNNETLDPLIFYLRNDDPRRLVAGTMLADNLRKMGIPVNTTEIDLTTCIIKVMMERDYHIYTGGWGINWALDYLSIYTSQQMTGSIVANYPHFSNATYDDWFQNALQAPNLSLARHAAQVCQQILVEQAACVWLWSPSYAMGYRNVGVVNFRGGRIDNRWTFLKTHNATKDALYYGLERSPASLNVVTDFNPTTPWSFGSVEDSCLSRIYDTLLSYSPYEKAYSCPGKIMPWMAETWEVGAWESPYDPGENLTKLSFILREGIRWHDGIPLGSTDVKFTIEYLKGLGSLASLFNSVAEVHHVTTPNPRLVVVYENVSNMWTLENIGSLPILPKHIFQDITNVTGYTPGADEGRWANETLIGSGPWKYVFHNDSLLHLEANRDYFMETPPEAEIDFRYDWEKGSWIVDAMDTTMVGEANGTSGYGLPHAKWEPGCDLNGDCLVNSTDIARVAQAFNATWGRANAYAYPPCIPLPEEAIYVETIESSILVGQNLTVEVKLDNITRLSGLQFELKYDNNKLDILDLNVAQIFESFTFEWKRESNQSKGFVWVSISAIGSTLQFSGNTTLATIVFNATNPGGSLLDLQNTRLARYGAHGATCQPMPHKAVDEEVSVGVYTPTGTDVEVAVEEGARVTFTETTTEGITTLSIAQAPSTEFVSVHCRRIETTATHVGDVTIAFNYDPTGLSLEDEESTKIWLWNETAESWVDKTTLVNTETNTVYGVTPHLSIFGVTRDLDVGFEPTSEEGEVTAGVLETPLDAPSGLVVLKCYEIQTTYLYTGPITIRLAYDEGVVPPEVEAFVQIWQWNEYSETWTDVTSFVNTDSNMVWGVTSHLSIFGVTSLPPATQVATTEAAVSKTVVGQGYNVTVDFTVENQGDFTETLDIVLYCNTTVLTTFPATLAPNARIAFSFTWDTTGWAKGNYALSACAHIMSWAFVTIPGDVDGDRDVDIYDIVRMSGVYGAEAPDQRYDAYCDMEDDGDIDIYDIVIAAGNYGDSW